MEVSRPFLLIFASVLTVLLITSTTTAAPPGGLSKEAGGIDVDPVDASTWDGMSAEDLSSSIGDIEPDYLMDNLDQIPDGALKDNLEHLADHCPDCVGELSEDRLKNLVDDPSELPEAFKKNLNSDQLATRIDDKPLFVDQPLNQFGQEAKDKAIQALTDSDEIRTTPNKDSTATIDGGKVLLNNLKEVTVGKTTITDGSDITLDDKEIHVEKAPFIDFYSTENHDVNDFDGSTESRLYTVGSADRLQADQFKAQHLQNAQVAVSDNLAIRTTMPYTVELGSGRQVLVTPREDHVLVGDPHDQGKIVVKNAVITEQFETATQQIEVSNDSTIFTRPSSGIECMQLNPRASYTYRVPDPRKVFSVAVIRKPHRICIRKEPTQHFIKGPESTFVAKNITLAGTPQLKRFFSRTLHPDHISLPDNSSKLTTSL